MKQYYKWAAGLFDGEGCIGLYKHKRKDMKYPLFEMNVSLSMTHFKTVKFFNKVMGVGTNGIKFNDNIKYPKNKPQLHYRAACNKALVVLKKLYPYLITKKREAKLAIEFQEKFGYVKVKGKHRNKLNHKLLKEKIHYHDELKRLKRL